MSAVTDLFGRRSPDDGPVRCHCDLNRNLLSVTALSGPQKGRVVDKPDRLVLIDVRFEVSAAGQARARSQNVRNVHAYARGRRSERDSAELLSRGDAVRVRYNPFERDSFFRDDTGEPITQADILVLDGRTKTTFGIGVR